MYVDNVRSETANTPAQSMFKFIDTHQDKDNDGLFSGIVVDNNDPDKQGKCRIRVYGIFEKDIPDDDLPWALPDFTFIGSKVGSFVVPPIDAIVKVYFDNGDIYSPHYTSKAVKANSQSTQKDIDYPHNMVLFESDDGDYLTVNRKAKITTFHHNSGTTITINKQGEVIFDVKGSRMIIKNAKYTDLGGSENTNLGGNMPALYCNIPGIKAITDLSQIGISNKTHVGI